MAAGALLMMVVIGQPAYVTVVAEVFLLVVIVAVGIPFWRSRTVVTARGIEVTAYCRAATYPWDQVRDIRVADNPIPNDPARRVAVLYWRSAVLDVRVLPYVNSRHLGSEQALAEHVARLQETSRARRTEKWTGRDDEVVRQEEELLHRLRGRADRAMRRGRVLGFAAAIVFVAILVLTVVSFE